MYKMKEEQNAKMHFMSQKFIFKPTTGIESVKMWKCTVQVTENNNIKRDGFLGCDVTFKEVSICDYVSWVRQILLQIMPSRKSSQFTIIEYLRTI